MIDRFMFTPHRTSTLVILWLACIALLSMSIICAWLWTSIPGTAVCAGLGGADLALALVATDANLG